VIDWFFSQYDGIPSHLVVLEIIGVVFGFLSVWFAKKENILVYPTGLVNTGIFVYILMVYGLLGDMLINAYYFGMSIFGWYSWTRKVDETHFIPVTRMTARDKSRAAFLFLGSIVFTTLVYLAFEKFNAWTAYVDTLTTAIFFVAMWLMALKKFEHWTFWIIGNVITIPLYLYKGLIFTAFQYLVFTLIAIAGYIAWKQLINKSPQRLLK